MVKALVSLQDYKSLIAAYLRVLLKSTFINQTFFTFYVEGLNCFALTQLMNVIDLQFATMDLCHCMGY